MAAGFADGYRTLGRSDTELLAGYLASSTAMVHWTRKLSADIAVAEPFVD